MSFTQEMRNTFSDQSRQIVNTTENVYNLLSAAHHNLESLFAGGMENKIPSFLDKTNPDQLFNDALEDVPMIRNYLASKMKGLEGTPEYKTMERRIDDYVAYVQGWHLYVYALSEDEYLYRGAYYATFQDPPKLEGLEKWNFTMAKLLSEWNFWQATLATTHGYPDRLILGRDMVYSILDNYAYRTIRLYDKLEYTEETAGVLEQAAKTIKKLNHNNVELRLSSIYEKNYFKNKDGNKNENNQSITENTDKNEPQIHSDNME